MNEFFVSRNSCPCCHSTAGDEFCRIPYTEDPLREYLVSFYSPQGGVELKYLSMQDYVLIDCDNCGLIYQKEIPGDFLMHKLYEEWINSKKVFDLIERTRGIDYFSRLGSEIVRIVKLLGRPPMELQLLDFSMGWGHWCRIARSFGCSVHGTEFSKARINYAKSTGVHVIEHDEIARYRYDFINTESVFEHLPEPRTILSYLKRSLKPHGILKISVPNGWNIKKKLKNWNWSAPKGSPLSLNPVAPLEHVNCFNHSSLRTLARESGLVPIDNGASLKDQLHSLTLKQRAKAALRPYWHRLLALRGQPFGKGNGTYLFFRVD